MAYHLSTPVSGLPGIGEKAVKDLRSIGIISVRDLLWYVPFRYDDFSMIKKIGEVKSGETVTIDAAVQSIGIRPSKFRRVQIVEAIIGDETGELKVIWFNQPYLLKTLPVGTRVSFAGSIDYRFGRTLANPIHEPVGRRVHTGRLVPVYGLFGSLMMRRLRDAIERSLSALPEMIDWLPSEIVEAESMPSLSNALSTIHFPDSHAHLERAINRLKFDELFLHQMLFEEIRRDRKKKTATPITIDKQSIKSFVDALPFQLTRAQKIAAWEIVQDLSQDTPMNRLLEGDVGSGKTAVAAIASNSVMNRGFLVVYLAPTEILAVQQHKSFLKMIPTKNVALLTHNHIFYNQEKLKRDQLIEKIANRDVDCLIGTHAILQEGIDLSSVSLIVIDEQHRFGVAQRHALLEHNPAHSSHLLSMTATPIPRSLALTIYGDLDVSILDELPKGRKPIGTAIVPEEHQVMMWNHVRSEIEAGRQAFVICPLIDPSDVLGARSVADVAKFLAKSQLKGLKIETLHGKLKADEKQKRNEDFRDGKIDVLVSTTVVEVGVDVPNATVMIILSAERFGLAQLHQLRGRVGRSHHQSYCYLIPDKLNDVANRRLQAVVESQNGFELAEKDLELRGAGNIFGNAQSGFPDFQFATMSDVSLMKKARDWSTRLLLRENFFETHPLVCEQMRIALEKVHME